MALWSSTHSAALRGTWCKRSESRRTHGTNLKRARRQSCAWGSPWHMKVRRRGFFRARHTRGASQRVVLRIVPRAPVHMASPLSLTWFAHDLAHELP
eukprot:5708251-Pyramimonas_sp.AAC.1